MKFKDELDAFEAESPMNRTPIKGESSPLKPKRDRIKPTHHTAMTHAFIKAMQKCLGEVTPDGPE